jgi:hypothetical protein
VGSFNPLRSNTAIAVAVEKVVEGMKAGQCNPPESLIALTEQEGETEEGQSSLPGHTLLDEALSKPPGREGAACDENVMPHLVVTVVVVVTSSPRQKREEYTMNQTGQTCHLANPIQFHFCSFCNSVASYYMRNVRICQEGSIRKKVSSIPFAGIQENRYFKRYFHQQAIVRDLGTILRKEVCISISKNLIYLSPSFNNFFCERATVITPVKNCIIPIKANIGESFKLLMI